MIAQGSGSIITIASASGLRGGLSGHIYSASKAAVIHLSRNVAAEISRRGVRVNTISPGGIVTGIFAKSSRAGRRPGGSGPWRHIESIRHRAAGSTRRSDRRHRHCRRISGQRRRVVLITGQDLAVDGGLVPFGKVGWEESIEFRAEITRRVRAQTSANLSTRLTDPLPGRPGPRSLSSANPAPARVRAWPPPGRSTDRAPSRR